MATRKRTARQRPDWEGESVHAAKVLGVTEAEMKRAIRDTLVRKAAEAIIEGRWKNLIQQAATFPISADAIKKAHESLFQEDVRKKKVYFPQDEQ